MDFCASIILSVIIPVYNEEDNVLPLYQAITDALATSHHTYEIIFINDGSTDKTEAGLNELAKKDKRVGAIHLKRNFGQTAAIMAGIDNAKGDIIIPMDGDLQNDPRDIPRLVEKLDQGYDVCSGWRKDRKDNPLKRNLPSFIANMLISRISGVHLNDYGCTLKAYKREVIKDVKLYGEMHRFIPIYATWQGAKVTEIPVSHHARKYGKSKYGLERTIKVVLDLMVVKFLAKYAQKPIYVFGSFGLFNLLIAFLAIAWAFYLKFFGDKSFVQTPLPLIFVMAAITGFMCILMGLLAEMIMRTYYESQDKPVYLIRESYNLKRGL